MAGHSKWANIQHRKGRQDEKRGKVWTRLIREIIVAARHGGGDLGDEPAPAPGGREGQGGRTCRPTRSSATSTRPPATSKACTTRRSATRATASAARRSSSTRMTDNRVRTVAEVRHAFSKYGGNMGTEGSVAFQFKHCGQFVFAPGANEDKVMEVALEAGADDVDHRRRRRDRGADRAGRLRGGEERRSRPRASSPTSPR